MVVNINAEIGNYKERVVGNYTLRQVICLILALVIGATTYFYLQIQSDIKQFIVMFTTLPVIAIGFYSYQGVTCEKYIYYMLREFFLPQKRPFLPEYELVKNALRENEEITDNDKKTIKAIKKRKNKKV